jgi:hypothetical protein
MKSSLQKSSTNRARSSSRGGPTSKRDVTSVISKLKAVDLLSPHNAGSRSVLAWLSGLAPLCLLENVGRRCGVTRV